MYLELGPTPTSLIYLVILEVFPRTYQSEQPCYSQGRHRTNQSEGPRQPRDGP